MPYPTALTTLAATKVALNLGAATGDDASITAMIPQVTELALRRMGRPAFFKAEVDQDEYPRPTFCRGSRLVLDRYPNVVITSLWVSSSVPRAYGAQELLVAGTDYLLDPDQGVVDRFSGYWPDGLRQIKVTYNGGHETIPADLERAAQEVIAFWLQKGKDRLYHVTSTELGDGQVQGIRFDIPETAAQVFDSYRDTRR